MGKGLFCAEMYLSMWVSVKVVYTFVYICVGVQNLDNYMKGHKSIYNLKKKLESHWKGSTYSKLRKKLKWIFLSSERYGSDINLMPTLLRAVGTFSTKEKSINL